MNCDQVFDVLTRGPFPTGAASDASVERHLTCCNDCRRLAIALRPAVELFEEAVRPEESRGLPSYWGEVSEPHSAAHDATFATLEEEIALAKTARRRVASANRVRGVMPIRAWEECDRMLRFCGAVAVGVLVAFGFRSIGEDSWRNRGAARNEHAATAAFPWQVCSAAWIASSEQPLQGSSMRTSGMLQLARLDADRHRCCSECHHEGGPTSAPEAMSRGVASSCVVCHDGDEPDEHEALLDSSLPIVHSEPGV
ncbi:MAG: hypothetical protein SGJ19_24835 [Planctomycetia bacterium]|nr:hypothetical protein [Planctomycetia bacterium]